MSDEKLYTLGEAHLAFAKAIHGEVWRLLEKPDRSKADDERMLYAAHASCYHWLNVGTPVNHQRGEWLIARVHTMLRDVQPALAHANRCLELTRLHPDLMQDFDVPFAHECAARANALAGNRTEAVRHLKLARKAGALIKDEEDRRVFFDELDGGEWFGVA